MTRPPIQAVIETQEELDTTRRNWRMVLFNEDGTPFTGGAGGDALEFRFAGVDGASTIEFAGLAVDDTALYELVLDGVISIGADSPITVRPTGGDYTSAASINRAYNDTGAQVQNASGPDNVGLILAYTGWTTNNEILATARLSLDPAKRARCKSSFVLHPDSNANQVMGGECASFLKVKAAIPSITIHFGGGTFAGTATLRQLQTLP